MALPFTTSQITEAFTSPSTILEPGIITTTPNVTSALLTPSAITHLSPQQVASMDKWQKYCSEHSPSKSLLWLLLSLLIGGILIAIIITLANRARHNQGIPCSVDQQCGFACKDAPENSICEGRCVEGRCKAVISCKPGYKWSAKDNKCIESASPINSNKNYAAHKQQNVGDYYSDKIQSSNMSDKKVKFDDYANYNMPTTEMTGRSSLRNPATKQNNGKDIWTPIHLNDKLKGSPWESKMNNGDASNPWATRYRRTAESV